MVDNENREKNSPNEKVYNIIIIILSCIVMLLSTIGLFGIVNINITNSIVIPMLGVITLLNGIKTYKRNKTVGIFLFCCVAIVFLICAVVFLFKIFG